MLTEAAVQHIANGMLESNQGLAATVKGDNISGGYNSTTKGLLASDLISRISGEVAARGAQTVNTIGASSSSTTNSGSTTTQVIGASDTFSLQDTDMTQIMGPSSTKAITSSDTQTDQHDLKETSGSKDTVETKAETESKWILCTELVRQNRMPLKYYRYGSREFASYDEQSKKGYYFWAVPMLAHLKKHPYSNTSRIVCALLNARAEYIAAEGGCKGARKTILGWGTKQMYWGCWLLSRTVARNYGNVNISGGYYANEIK
jgi:hypothetical protein